MLYSQTLAQKELQERFDTYLSKVVEIKKRAHWYIFLKTKMQSWYWWIKSNDNDFRCDPDIQYKIDEQNSKFKKFGKKKLILENLFSNLGKNLIIYKKDLIHLSIFICIWCFIASFSSILFTTKQHLNLSDISFILLFGIDLVWTKYLKWFFSSLEKTPDWIKA